jgi:hypothetical protein
VVSDRPSPNIQGVMHLFRVMTSSVLAASGVLIITSGSGAAFSSHVIDLCVPIE